MEAEEKLNIKEMVESAIKSIKVVKT